MRKVLVGLVVLLCAGGAKAAQELSTFVYPSEDELEEAFYKGEIDFLQLLTLQEIIRFGIDSTQLYLLDEIPNLSYFLETRAPEQPQLLAEQESSFLVEKTPKKVVTGEIFHNYSQRLETDGASRYRTSGVLNLGEIISTAFRLHKEYSGDERLVDRKIEFRPNNSTVRKIVLGNYTTRYGLGTIIGYRGKLLNFSDEINGESILYPDYGGYNGLNMKFKKSAVESELMFSQNRDDSHSLRTIAGRIGKAGKKFAPMLMASLTNLRDRKTGNSIDDFKYGVNVHSKYKNGYNRLELSAQAGETNSFGAVLTEGRHQSKRAEINYALWYYDEKYLDLTGGSKAANIRNTVELNDVDFSYPDKRSGQTGGLLKTIVELNENIDLVNSIIYAEKDNENYNFEFLSAIEKKLSAQLQLRVDHVSRNRHRLQSTTETDETFRRSRVELKFINPELYVRTYLAYQSETDEDDYMSLFVNCRYKKEHIGETSVWLNIGEFEHNDGDINYWYGFLDNRQKLFENVKTIVKFAHSYRRGQTDEHVSTFSVGLEAAL